MSDIQDFNEENINKQYNNDYEKLKEIGAQRIHEETHIPKAQTFALVHGNFESMNKIQFLGFVSIVEREYSLDLSELKDMGLEHFFDGHHEEEILTETKVFVSAKKSKSYTLYYIAVAIIIFLIVALGDSSSDKKVEPKIDNKNIEEVTLKISPKGQSDDISVSAKIDDIPGEFTIIPRSELWIGYIDMDSGKKHQIITSDNLNLDPKVNWLISVGHGNVTFNVDGESDKYSSSRSMRFIYKDGELKKISRRHYLSLNEGKEW